MKHSFIQPRRKKVVGAELKWLLSIFVLLVAVMSGGAAFLNYSIGKSEQIMASTETKMLKLQSEQKTLVIETARLQQVDKLRERISTANRLKKENVKNFFDLVPGDVTLELAEFRANTLRLTGIANNKKQFNETFQLSLESHFSRSSTVFTKLEDGSYRFENISIMEPQQ